MSESNSGEWQEMETKDGESLMAYLERIEREEAEWQALKDKMVDFFKLHIRTQEERAKQLRALASQLLVAMRVGRKGFAAFSHHNGEYGGIEEITLTETKEVLKVDPPVLEKEIDILVNEGRFVTKDEYRKLKFRVRYQSR